MVLVLAFAVRVVNDVYTASENRLNSIANFSEQAKDYLYKKYSMNFKVYDGSYKDHFRAKACLDGSRSLSFSVWKTENGIFYDDYLEYCLENDAQKALEELFSQHFSVYKCNAILNSRVSGNGDKGKLYSYYKTNGKPMSWDDSECEERLWTACITIETENRIITDEDKSLANQLSAQFCKKYNTEKLEVRFMTDGQEFYTSDIVLK